MESETKKDDVGEGDGDDADGEDAAAATDARDGWDGEVELLFDREAPKRADRAKPTRVQDVEVADEKRKGEDGVSADGRAAVIEAAECVAGEQDKEVEGPDSQDAPDGELAQVNFARALFFTQEDGDDEVGAEHEEHAHAEGSGFDERLEPASVNKGEVITKNRQEGEKAERV